MTRLGAKPHAAFRNHLHHLRASYSIATHSPSASWTRARPRRHEYKRRRSVEHGRRRGAGRASARQRRAIIVEGERWRCERQAGGGGDEGIKHLPHDLVRLPTGFIGISFHDGISNTHAVDVSAFYSIDLRALASTDLLSTSAAKRAFCPGRQMLSDQHRIGGEGLRLDINHCPRLGVPRWMMNPMA